MVDYRLTDNQAKSFALFMKNLNIRYVLAAGQIVDASEMGIELVREEPFSSAGSYYEIWLYKIP